MTNAPQAPPDRPRLRDRQGPCGLHRCYRRVGGRPHLRNTRRSRQSALVLVANRQRPHDASGPRSERRLWIVRQTKKFHKIFGRRSSTEGRVLWTWWSCSSGSDGYVLPSRRTSRASVKSGPDGPCWGARSSSLPSRGSRNDRARMLLSTSAATGLEPPQGSRERKITPTRPMVGSYYCG